MSNRQKYIYMATSDIPRMEKIAVNEHKNHPFSAWKYNKYTVSASQAKYYTH